MKEVGGPRVVGYVPAEWHAHVTCLRSLLHPPVPLTKDVAFAKIDCPLVGVSDWPHVPGVWVAIHNVLDFLPIVLSLPRAESNAHDVIRLHAATSEQQR